MASKLNPYLMFPGTAREAMQHYASVLGGNLELHTFGETGAPEPLADQIMHARLETDAGFTLMASDMPPGTEHSVGSNMAVSLSGDDEPELRGYWDALSDGGTITVALEKQIWGDVFGACTDRFGVPWMVNIGQPQA